MFQCPICERNTSLPVGMAIVFPQNLHLGSEVDVALYTSKMVNNSDVCCDECVDGRYDLADVLKPREHDCSQPNHEDNNLIAYCVYVRMYGDPNRPSGITIDDEGYSLVSEYGGHCLSIYDPEGNKIHTVRNLNNPYGTALDPRDGSVFIANCGANTVLKYSVSKHILHTTIKVFTQEGVYVRMYGGPNGPIGIAIDDEGYSLVSERSSNCLSIYDPEGNKIHAVKNLKNPIGAKLDGSVFIANCGANTIMKILKRDEKKMEKDERAVEWKIAKKCKLCDIKEATERTQHGPSSQPTQK
eukprot:Em0004g367a